MKKKIYGYIKVFSIVLIDSILLKYYINNWLITDIIVGSIILYSFCFGELFSIVRADAIYLDKLDEMRKNKLLLGYDILKKQYYHKYGRKLKVKVYLIPDEYNFNAYAFGIHRIGITSDAVSRLDSYSISACLAHELGHTLSLDIVVKRLLIANFFVISSILVVTQLICELIIILICMMIICLVNSYIGVYVTTGLLKKLNKIIKRIFGVIIILLQGFIALVDRNREYAADELACDLGFSYQLLFVLKYYVGEVPLAQCIGDLLYATHPKTAKRITKIEKKMKKINYKKVK